MPAIFVSHASEDKADFVRPLAHALKKCGLKVWYDEFTLRPGDSLRRSIDKGLGECAGGIVILSPAFFAKEWPQRELDALFSAEIAGRTRLVPIWHKLKSSQVASVSPLLADRVAIRSDLGVEEVASRIAGLFPAEPKLTGAAWAEIIEQCQDGDFYAGEARYKGCQYRFLQLQAVNEKYSEILEEAHRHLTDDELGEAHPAIDLQLETSLAETRRRLGVPTDVYLDPDEPESEAQLRWWLDRIGQWASGTLSREASVELVDEIDHCDLDEYYILLGAPNFAISGRQRPLLERAVVELGCGFESEYEELVTICNALRDFDGDG